MHECLAYLMMLYSREYHQGLEWYRQQMPLSLPSQITLEKTPNYLVDWDVPERVFKFNESIKLILIVREPISRAVSDYVQLRVSFLLGGCPIFPSFFYLLSFNKKSHDLRADKNICMLVGRPVPLCRMLEKYFKFYFSRLLLTTPFLGVENCQDCLML